MPEPTIKNNAMNPKVSIVIPVYNGANYVAEAIESALGQTYKNLEVVVVNDGSTDNGATEEAIRPYLDRIVYVKKENGGVSSALNVGIKTMTGDYFSWLSHDDFYSPDKIEKQVALIQSPSDIILCVGGLMDSAKKALPHHFKGVSGRFSGAEMFEMFINGYELNGLAFLIPKTLFCSTGDFDENMRYLQDLDMWLRMFINEPTIVCHQDKLVFTRIHAAQTTNTMSDQFLVDREKLISKHVFNVENYLKSKETKEKFLRLYYLLAVKGNNKPGKRAALNALSRIDYNIGKLKSEAIPYEIKGMLKRSCRKIYYLILKVKGVRN